MKLLVLWLAAFAAEEADVHAALVGAAICAAEMAAVISADAGVASDIVKVVDASVWQGAK